MIKRIAAILLAFALILSVVASCSKKDTPTADDEQSDRVIDENKGQNSNDDDEPLPNTDDAVITTEPAQTPGKEHVDAQSSRFPSREDIDAKLNQIPEYEIRQTLYQEIRADDGVLLAFNEFNQPVFIGDGKNVLRMNSVFEDDLVGVNLDDFDYLPEAYNNREEYVYSEAQEGRAGGTSRVWKESYRKNQYISFVNTIEWDGLGAHGGVTMFGRVFDTINGELLTIYDILNVSKDYIVDVLYYEFIAYHNALGDGLDEMALGYDSGYYDDYYEASVKEQCGENVVFWLANDGVHIYFHQYTFYYALGATELIIPYDRTDLVKEPFAAPNTTGASDSPIEAPGWKYSYMNLLLGAQAYVDNTDWEDHDYLGNYPLFVSEILLADLNFDGIPEVFIFGDGAGASAFVRVFAITKTGIEKILQDWCDVSAVKLYCNLDDGSLAYGFISGNGEYDYYEGNAYITNSGTKLNSTFKDAAKMADFSFTDEYEYDPDTYFETYLGTTYRFNGRVVSNDDYDLLYANLYSGYEEVKYSPAVLSWDYGSSLTIGDFRRFLDSYVAER